MQHPLKLTVIVQDGRNRTRVRSTLNEVPFSKVEARAGELAKKAANMFRGSEPEEE